LTLYVPAYTLVLVVVDGEDWLEEHPLAPPISAAASNTISNPPSRRLRGSASKSSDATVTPDPSRYHGARLDFFSANIVPGSTLPGIFGIRRFAVMPVIVIVDVADAEELIVTDAGLNVKPGT
jgi:hypothetical protein